MNDVLRSQFDADLAKAATLNDLEAVRVQFFGKQGHITERLKELGKMDPDERKRVGAELNALRDTLQSTLNTKKEALEDAALAEKLASEKVDMTLPPLVPSKGNHHLITQTIREITNYFAMYGFVVKKGPDIDTEDHNFDALNIPSHHPARQSHDTFYVEGMENHLLRTHTSTIQIRTLRNEKPPLRILAPGRVYRADYDATHLPMFHQIEGMVIDKDIHIGHLKSCLIDFCRYFFNANDLKVRFRPSFFPFTEPSFEMDIWGEGRWLEVLGCGMTHPNVLKNCGVDPDQYQGFAFGMGIERFAMIKHKIADIRDLVGGDIRWSRSMGIPSTFAA